MDLLEAERTLHLSIDAEYAHLRGLQKATGYRSPPRNEVTPTEPRRWHGDERVGARHTLESFVVFNVATTSPQPLPGGQCRTT
jgi:hypothetical protein